MTSVQKRMGPRRSLLGASVDQTDARTLCGGSATTRTQNSRILSQLMPIRISARPTALALGWRLCKEPVRRRQIASYVVHPETEASGTSSTSLSAGAENRLSRILDDDGPVPALGDSESPGKMALRRRLAGQDRVTEKRNRKRRKTLLDAAQPVVACVGRAGTGEDKEVPLSAHESQWSPTGATPPDRKPAPDDWSRSTARPLGSIQGHLGGWRIGIHSLHKTAINDQDRKSGHH